MKSLLSLTAASILVATSSFAANIQVDVEEDPFFQGGTGYQVYVNGVASGEWINGHDNTQADEISDTASFVYTKGRESRNGEISSLNNTIDAKNAEIASLKAQIAALEDTVDDAQGLVHKYQNMNWTFEMSAPGWSWHDDTHITTPLGTSDNVDTIYIYGWHTGFRAGAAHVTKQLNSLVQ